MGFFFFFSFFFSEKSEMEKKYRRAPGALAPRLSTINHAS